MTITFHADPRSSVVGRTVLFAKLANIPFEILNVDITKDEQFTPEYLALNPFHHVPVLEDKAKNLVIYNSTAIMIYLARAYAPEWISDDPIEASRIAQFNDTITDELKNMADCYFTQFVYNKRSEKYDSFTQDALRLFKVYDQELAGKDWFVGNRPTLVEPVVYIHYELVTAIDIDLSAFPNLQAWARRVEALPRFEKML